MVAIFLIVSVLIILSFILLRKSLSGHVEKRTGRCKVLAVAGSGERQTLQERRAMSLCIDIAFAR
jgi:phage FluMu protein Com